VVILLELNKRPLSGNDVISFIHNKHNISLSPSTVFTCLYTLENDGLVKSESNSKKRIFTLTDLGKQTAQEFLDAKTKILGLLLNIFVGE
jgi:DNA-binding PadR family transcriptional regulator